ncbi:hypothetical protein BATDEDRAFT_25050 [Batrachochytrium dendrobatidis JAM81]|uniref:Ribosomal protein S6 n=2 Tax=Batrachochytrium dendrobatidis TaxID=109871 RepID=F4P3J7_BATDJ|nr:uncharacterized protein BATDEDRAFT_25050 [Batrachochytrium dendrobatidis JAM81]EGF80454.1 hypothetical protein BATDEDRAFT_25050 [Batrachochytrium dendrobatidis JAM81]KAJ8326420.1 hypothetical protein O5D80_005171 [Batrachochytrium dendrobatidis]KAK5666792.1 hypothetical protein QVD99_006846 [Batrachochytrium dendrobatidis]OAJ41067.1 ribosomal protein S6 [Batrachochytrium dendrobatidis JEL423]|eukprot:XP_006678998.1 hypothetical protein BATDEDRAFT_25050 [Batrachochytrium dendrobatidis JAM81]
MYELVLIARTKVNSMSIATGVLQAEKAKHKQLLKQCAMHVLDNNGVVRQFINLGKKDLPYRMKRHQEIHAKGAYFTMQFDASPLVMKSLSSSLALNEDVIRHTVINCGDSLEAVTTHIAAEKL